MRAIGSSVETFWDRAYRDGEHLEHWEPPAPPPELLAAIEAKLAQPGQAALDIGCGAGAEALILAKAALSVVAVDSSRAALELARHRAVKAGFEIDWRLGTALSLPVADHSIDFAVDRGCLHTLEPGSWRRYAKQVRRVLKPGGRLLLRGACRDDEELGLVGLEPRRLARAFGPFGFRVGPADLIMMAARSGDLEAHSVVIRLE